MKFVLFWLFVGCAAVVCDGYHSCKDLKAANPSAKSGKYEFYNGKGEKYESYCEFQCGHGYQFLSIESLSFVQSALDLIKPNTKEVLVRHVRSDGKQYDTTMEQISMHSSLPLSIQYNQNIGYATPLNHQNWAPYIYLGFLPKSIAAMKTTQGYRANGKDYNFHNCDANPNSYLAFFYNKGHADPNGYYKRCCYTALMRDWINAGKPASDYLSCEFFFQFEMHMGGCGGYAINGQNTLQDIVGAALGMRFEYGNTPGPHVSVLNYE